MSESCLFCRLARKPDRPFFVLAEEALIAFPALHPINEGHLIVTPRRHLDRVSEVPAPLAAALLGKAGELGEALREELGCNGFTLLLHEGVSDQPLPHLHVNVIPRHADDALSVTKPPEAEREALSSLAARLRARLHTSRNSDT